MAAGLFVTSVTWGASMLRCVGLRKDVGVDAMRQQNLVGGENKATLVGIAGM